MPINTTNEIEIYELDGNECTGIGSKKPFEVIVSNHWNLSRMVVIQVGNKKVTVLASELKRAIDNATNAHP